ncbi:pentatricopeptide repeat-containing protein At2g01860 [Amborella trichopoda]|uniref:Pentacotripeptide-repeat region of PRORP domain-containing protein n=1 Tax=Amborella trichopoda TaxID=13333 RepID=U5D713_AMBTC|nr:pentatricopeptide repeat-containing protein At2g01860 [Amborella trichopoda]ERN17207.1 hypothetical protein AMTR_s00044p00163060 [Amborella trichopoda]|eukprot:XP_006855740.1 pentatricopeptide repeat-containing protein At2g01860 [Amborella trichopoda]
MASFLIPNQVILRAGIKLVNQQFISIGYCRYGENSCFRIQMMATKHKKKPKNLRYPRRQKLPVDPALYKIQPAICDESSISFEQGVGLERGNSPNPNELEAISSLYQDEVRRKPRTLGKETNISYERGEEGVERHEDSWSPDELDTIFSLFQGRIPQKPGKLGRVRPLPLPTPHKLRPLGLPSPKNHIRSAYPAITASRSSLCKLNYKNPDFLLEIAREIRGLPPEKNSSEVLNKRYRILRKGSLSLTIRELGHMGLPHRALETFCWAQRHPHLFPDDRLLASTVEVLARTGRLKNAFNFADIMSSASRTVIEAMAKGCIRGGQFNLARKILLVAKDTGRTLDVSVSVMLLAEIAKFPDKKKLAIRILEELGEREELNLRQQDSTAIMKACVKLQRFDAVESLYNWFMQSGQDLSVVMYTTVVHSRYIGKRYREAMALVWEMEGSNCLLDLPAYRVIIRLCVALDDLARAVRYFSRLKDAGFSPTHDIYSDLIELYARRGRLAKCREIRKEMEMVGFKLGAKIVALLEGDGKVKLIAVSSSKDDRVSEGNLTC